MKLKHFICVIALMLAGSAAVYAETPEEIARKMSAQIERCETEGYSMDMNVKIIIIGNVVTHIQRFGGKMRMDIHQDGKDATSWTDGNTHWDYDYTTNEVTITTKESTSEESEDSELKALKNLDEGYKITLKEETPESWLLVCKKKASNKDKKGFKKMNITVSKADYLPLSVTSKGSILANLSIHNVKLDVTEKDVVFNAADFPGVSIIDNR